MPACTCNCWRSLWLQSPGTPLLHLPHTPTHANSPRLSEDGKGWVDGCWGSSKTYYITGVPSPHIFSAPAEAVTSSKANGRVGVEEGLSYTLLLWDLSILAHAFTSSPLHFLFSQQGSHEFAHVPGTLFSVGGGVVEGSLWVGKEDARAGTLVTCLIYTLLMQKLFTSLCDTTERFAV